MAYRCRVKDTQSAAVKFVEWKIRKYVIVLFTKSYSPEGQMCHCWLREYNKRRDNYDRVFYDKRGDMAEMDTYLWTLSGESNRESQHIFVRGDYLGGYKTLVKLMQSGKLQRILENLVNFLPGASNYLSSNKSWNLAHEADPDILPDLVLKVELHDPFPGTLVKVVKCDRDLVNVDCGHFGRSPTPVQGSHSDSYFPDLESAGSSVSSLPPDKDKLNRKSDQFPSFGNLPDQQDLDTVVPGRVYQMFRMTATSFSRLDLSPIKEQHEAPTAGSDTEGGKIVAKRKSKSKTKMSKRKTSRSSALIRNVQSVEKNGLSLLKTPKP